ncbi:MAG: hypothetical protein Q9170_001308 [Blastenia crenularia]
MPFIPHTPESRISRSDSKDEATTCKGTTSTGRPCRRALNVRKPNDGVLAVLPRGNSDADGAAAFFCWQHKDQAASFVSEDQSSGATHLYPLKGRTSTDTLVERLGLIDLGEPNEHRVRRKKMASSRPTHRATKEGLPGKWQEIPGPLLSVSASEKPHRPPPPRQRRPHPLLSLLCCLSPQDPDVDYTAKPVPRREAASSLPISQAQSIHLPVQANQSANSTPRKHHRRSSSARPALSDKSTKMVNRPLFPRDQSSQTEGLLAWIPKTLSPQITSQLLAELAKTVSEHDDEGYIYMFWLTTAEGADASALFTPSPMPSPRSRRASAGSSGISVPPLSKLDGSNPSTILLKIGRASNVQRRMNEWTRQCGYNLSLIRFYPYVTSTPQGSPSSQASSSRASPRKVPHAHKVERLIHLELADKRVKKDCETCGKEHREWFEVNGDRQGVKAVDEVIRRWVRWGETMT